MLFSCVGKQRKSLQAEQKPFRALYFWVPGAETYMSIWYQPNASRKCQICSACAVQTARTCSVNLPCRDVSGSQHTAHKNWILHVQKCVVHSVLPHNGQSLSTCALSQPRGLLTSITIADDVSSLCKTEQGLSSCAIYVHREVEPYETTPLETLDSIAHVLRSRSMLVF